MSLARFITTLDQPLEAEQYGGKAARLSEARCANLLVPPGFALHPALVAKAAQNQLTTEEETVLAEHLARLENVAVAVRSSALSEDGADASFAGQHSSFLNVQGLPHVLEAVRGVWASAQTPSAKAYRARMQVAGDSQIAALIMSLIPAEVAGVLFTGDPASGSKQHWVIEATWGLGEAVVSGLVTPDYYRITPDGVVIEQRPGIKDVAIVAVQDSSGTEEVTLDEPDKINRLCLDEMALKRLAELGQHCEAIFGPGQDIEWAIAGDRLFLLQCRPITAGG